jgi:histidinol-phosphatase
VRPSPDLPYALALADEADALTMRYYRALDLAVETKADLTPVTHADRAVEEVLRDRIRRERGEAVAGEEYGIEEGECAGGSTRSTARPSTRAACRSGRH